MAGLAVAGYAFNSYIYNEKLADENGNESNEIYTTVVSTDPVAEDDDNSQDVITPSRLALTDQPWTWERALYNDGREIVPRTPQTFSITFAADGSFGVTTDCNMAGGSYLTEGNSLIMSEIFSTLMYCEGTQETEFIQLLENTSSFFFTDTGKLIFELKFDSGSVTFR